jgi:hypothetical protein
MDDVTIVDAVLALAPKSLDPLVKPSVKPDFQMLGVQPDLDKLADERDLNPKPVPDEMLVRPWLRVESLD